MENTKNKIHLSEYLQENIDINKLGNKTCIISGVGSGKNHWVENELIKYGNILLITSRRAKVEETKLMSIFKGNLTKTEINNNVVYTNSGMEWLIKNNIIEGAFDSICDYFDFVVIDEAHSLVSDSSFADSPFHIWSFIKKMSEKMKFILMTGTFEPIEKLIIENGWNIINATNECENNKPNRIVIDSKENILNHIKSKIVGTEKSIYMANSANYMVSYLYEKIYENSEIRKEEISFAMSDSKVTALVAEGKFHCEEHKRLDETFESIINTKKLPSDIKILLTTSRLKEGINIKDKNIKDIYCESHISSDLIQFAGRVRTGVETLYIVNDIKQNNNNDIQEIDYMFCKESGVDACNLYLSEIEQADIDLLIDICKISVSKTIGNIRIKEFVSFIESKFKYIRYNHLENRFELYELRHISVEKCLRDLKEYNEDTSKYIKSVFGFTDSNVHDKVLRKKYFEKIGKKIIEDEIEDILNRLSKNKEKYFKIQKDNIMRIVVKSLKLNKGASLILINNELDKMNSSYQIINKKETKQANLGLHYIMVVHKSN